MTWCNGFSTTLTLRCKALGRHRCGVVQRSPDGRWKLCEPGGGWLRAELVAAWIAGPAAGLRFRAPRRGRLDVVLLAGAQDREHWRRLRVQLKLPPI